MASPARHEDALSQAGFANIQIASRNAWYREHAEQELAMLSGELYPEAIASLGRDFVDHNIAIWRNMIPVLETGEHCLTHLRGFKPLR